MLKKLKQKKDRQRFSIFCNILCKKKVSGEKEIDVAKAKTFQCPMETA